MPRRKSIGQAGINSQTLSKGGRHKPSVSEKSDIAAKREDLIQELRERCPEEEGFIVWDVVECLHECGWDIDKAENLLRSRKNPEDSPNVERIDEIPEQNREASSQGAPVQSNSGDSSSDSDDTSDSPNTSTFISDTSDTTGTSPREEDPIADDGFDPLENADALPLEKKGRGRELKENPSDATPAQTSTSRDATDEEATGTDAENFHANGEPSVTLPACASRMKMDAERSSPETGSSSVPGSTDVGSGQKAADSNRDEVIECEEGTSSVADGTVTANFDRGKGTDNAVPPSDVAHPTEADNNNVIVNTDDDNGSDGSDAVGESKTHDVAAAFTAAIPEADTRDELELELSDSEFSKINWTKFKIVYELINDLSDKEFETALKLDGCAQVDELKLLHAKGPFLSINKLRDAAKELKVTFSTLESLLELASKQVELCNTVQKAADTFVDWFKQTNNDAERNKAKQMQLRVFSDGRKIKAYQADAIAFLEQNFKNGFGACLAAESGLGKKCSVVRFLKHILGDSKEKPAAILTQDDINARLWSDEIKLWAPGIQAIFAEDEILEKSSNPRGCIGKIFISTFSGFEKGQIFVKSLNTFVQDFSCVIYDCRDGPLTDFRKLTDVKLSKRNVNVLLSYPENLQAFIRDADLLDILNFCEFVSPRSGDLEVCVKTLGQIASNQMKLALRKKILIVTDSLLLVQTYQAYKNEFPVVEFQRVECVLAYQQVENQEVLQKKMGESSEYGVIVRKLAQRMWANASHAWLSSGRYTEAELQEMATYLSEDEDFDDLSFAEIQKSLQNASAFQLFILAWNYKAINAFAASDDALVNDSGKVEKLKEVLEEFKEKGVTRAVILANSNDLLQLLNIALNSPSFNVEGFKVANAHCVGGTCDAAALKAFNALPRLLAAGSKPEDKLLLIWLAHSSQMAQAPCRDVPVASHLVLADNCPAAGCPLERRISHRWLTCRSDRTQHLLVHRLVTENSVESAMLDNPPPGGGEYETCPHTDGALTDQEMKVLTERIKSDSKNVARS